jgi:DNA-binding CsgD family transcriptional regulator
MRLDISEHLLPVIEAIYAAAPDPSKWPTALQLIADLFNDIGAIIIWARDDGSFGTIVSRSLERAQRDYTDNRWSKSDLLATRAAEKALWTTRDAVTDRHAVSEHEVNTHPFYTEFLRRHGLRWRAALGVAPDPRVQVALSVQRSDAKPPFTDEELDVLTRIGRYVEQALRLSIRLMEAESNTRGLGQALTRVGIGVFALDSLGRVLFKNLKASNMLGDSVRIVDNKLRVASGEQHKHVQRLIAECVESSPECILSDPKPIIVRELDSEPRYVLYLLPVLETNPAAEFLTSTRVIALLIEWHRDTAPDPSLVRDLLGISLGQARVVALLGEGQSLREAAECLGITEQSARTILKRAFLKTGISRQSELVAALERLALRGSA